MRRCIFTPPQPTLTLFCGLLFVGISPSWANADTGDVSGGWIVGDKGFASRSRVTAGVTVSIRVLAMGNGRGIAVTYSGNPQAHTPGKLWNRPELREGSILRYRIPESLRNVQLAIRSGAASGGFDKPLRVEASEFSYRLLFVDGRQLLVSVATGVPDPGSVVDDQSGGWLVGDTGFASQMHVRQGATVSIRIAKMGNSRGIVITYSGNPRIDTPGKLWNRTELGEGRVVRYTVSRALNNARLAIRSGAAAGGFDKPLRVESTDDSYQLFYAGGRVLSVNVTRPRR